MDCAWFFTPFIALLSARLLNNRSAPIVLGILYLLTCIVESLLPVSSGVSIGRRMSNQAEWRKALEELPSTPDKIPAFFFAHGSPRLAFPQGEQSDPTMENHAPGGSLATFLRDFGPALLKKYNPKGIVVFSAHWETLGERLGRAIVNRKSR